MPSIYFSNWTRDKVSATPFRCPLPILCFLCLLPWPPPRLSEKFYLPPFLICTPMALPLLFQPKVLVPFTLSIRFTVIVNSFENFRCSHMTYLCISNKQACMERPKSNQNEKNALVCMKIHVFRLVCIYSRTGYQRREYKCEVGGYGWCKRALKPNSQLVTRQFYLFTAGYVDPITFTKAKANKVYLCSWQAELIILMILCNAWMT